MHIYTHHQAAWQSTKAFATQMQQHVAIVTNGLQQIYGSGLPISASGKDFPALLKGTQAPWPAFQLDPFPTAP